MGGGHNSYLLAMDMAKVGGLLSLVKVFTGHHPKSTPYFSLWLVLLLTQYIHTYIPSYIL